MAAGRAKAGPRKVLVTAGPTREHLDPVRYLSNESSGRMGFEIAAAAARAGARVTLVAGPVNLSTPPGVVRIDVVSAREMQREAARAFRQADALFMCAAVADWRPIRKRAGKWRKEGESKEIAIVRLVRNPDILAALAGRKGRRLVVGFALETGAGEARARAKLRRKGADYIVLNDERALGAVRTSVTILGRDGSRHRLAGRTKRAVAEVLVRLPDPGTQAAGGHPKKLADSGGRDAMFRGRGSAASPGGLSIDAQPRWPAARRRSRSALARVRPGSSSASG